MRLYDPLATVYDRWLSGDDAAAACAGFYLSEIQADAAPVVELGVGTGRIARQLARQGVRVIGVDVSLAMLQSTSRQSDSSLLPLSLVCGVFERLPFVESSIRTVILPMRTVGHLVDQTERRSALAEVFRVLRPGGRLVFDHYNFDRAWAEAHDGRPRLMYAGKADGRDDGALLIWDRYDYDFSAETLHCTVRIEQVGVGGQLLSFQDVEFDFRWYALDEMVANVTEAGFVVESCWGDFNRKPFSPDAEHIVLSLRKP